MTASEHNHDLIVGRVRVAGRQVDPIVGKMRLARIFAEASLQTSLPGPSAVLVVRRVHDPLPGSLRLNGSDVQKTRGWERALSASLNQFVRKAARPALGPVPSSAESVVFLDRSEMLACLASDWCDGSAITHWWWRSLFRAADVTSAVVQEWLTSIEYAPAAFAKLAEKGHAVGFAGSLADAAVSRLLDEITRSFGLGDLRVSIARSRIENQPRATGLSEQSKPSRSKLSEPLSPRVLAELRTRLAPEAFAPHLTPHARVLLAAALMLERAPAMLRTGSVARRLTASLLAADPTDVISAPTMIDPFEPNMAPGIERSQQEPDFELGRSAPNEDNSSELLITPGGLRATTTFDEKPRSDDRVRRDLPRAPIEPQRKTGSVLAAPLHLPSESERDKDPQTRRSLAPARVSTEVGEHSPPDEMLANVNARANAKARAIEESRATEKTWPIEAASPSKGPRATLIQQSAGSAATIEASCETGFGGVFYLINAALALSLYGDFTRPLEPGIDLSIWDFLALVGRELNGKQIESDPIWALLTRLAGRRVDERPGDHFNAPEEWRTPPEWLEAFPESGEWSYQTSRGRLIVRHAADFTVLSVKLGPRFRARDIAARLANETSGYSNIAMFRRRRPGRDGFALRGRERRLERWTRWISEYLRVRLARAVGIVPAGELVATTVFSCAARVEVTPARLDVFFSLAELPVEVRLSGLDRDPGWVPAAGRSIAFHFD